MQFLQDILVKNTSKNVEVGSIGAIKIDDRHSHGYYMVEFASSTYTIHENKNISGQFMEYIELVANGRHFSHAISYPRWYVTPRDGNIEIFISLKIVIQRDMTVIKIRSISELQQFIKTIKRRNYYSGIHFSCYYTIINYYWINRKERRTRRTIFLSKKLYHK